jgi:hypothetical protein
LERLGPDVGARQQVIDRAGEMTVDDLGERVGEVGLRVDVVQFASLDQRSDCRPAFGATVGAGEERILARESEGLIDRSTGYLGGH